MSAPKAVAIERVSTRRQTPGLQSPELIARVKSRRYKLVKTFTLAVSARKGKQQAVLDQILEGARNGDWSVVLCVAIDRVERRGIAYLRDWLSDLHQAGARLESTSSGEEWLSEDRNDLMWNIRLDVEADRARREAEIRAERVARGHAYKDELQQGRVKLPLGWRYDKRAKFDSSIVTDAEALAAVRAAFQLAADGATLQQISADMAERGYGRTPEAISTLLRMSCYSTGELYVPVPVSVEPVIGVELQAQAIAALEARRTYTGPRNRKATDTDYAGRVFCYEHLNPLHRTYGPKRKDGSRQRYYRARTSHGRECDCGIFNADGVDDLVETLGMVDDEPETEMVVTGTDTAVRLAQIEQQRNRIWHDRKKTPGYLDKIAELDAEQERLESGAGQWQRRETGRTLGEAWRSMSRAEQRRYLERQAETGNWRMLVFKGRYADTGKKFMTATVRPFGHEHDYYDVMHTKTSKLR